MFDIQSIRKEYPITEQCFKIYGSEVPRRLIYFDHGASTHAPIRVMNKYIDFLKNYYANVHRGKHFLSMISSELFDNVYETIFEFIKADKEKNRIVLTSNTTTALDIASNIMSSYDGATLVSMMEHHSNDLLHRKRGEVIHFGVYHDGTIDMGDLQRKLKEHKVKLVAITSASNVTGYLPDIHNIAKLAHEHGARILVDAAQLLAHREIDVKENADAEHIDFLAAAGHKAYAPFGSAFMFGPKDIMDDAEPYIPGGGTVLYVTPDDAYYGSSPDRHQGGTPNIAGCIALAESLKFLSEIGMDEIRKHEADLTEYALNRFNEISEVHLLGNIQSHKRLGVVSFNVGDLNNGLVASILNHEAAIAVRNGGFCAQPYMHFLLGYNNSEELIRKLSRGEKIHLPGAVRLSLGIYNTTYEIDQFIDQLKLIAKHKWKADYDSILAPTFNCKEVELNGTEN